MGRAHAAAFSTEDAYASGRGCLFAGGMTPVGGRYDWLVRASLIANPYSETSLPDWIRNAVRSKSAPLEDTGCYVYEETLAFALLLSGTNNKSSGRFLRTGEELQRSGLSIGVQDRRMSSTCRGAWGRGGLVGVSGGHGRIGFLGVVMEDSGEKWCGGESIAAACGGLSALRRGIEDVGFPSFYLETRAMLCVLKSCPCCLRRGPRVCGSVGVVGRRIVRNRKGLESRGWRRSSWPDPSREEFLRSQNQKGGRWESGRVAAGRTAGRKSRRHA